MRIRGWHIVVALMVLAVSCRGPRTIPRDDLADIFHDIFLQDQLIKTNPSLKRLADTSLVYQGIFQEYGYDTDDYLYSMSKYIKEPDKLAKVFEKVADRLSKEAKSVEKQVLFEQWRDKLMAIYKHKIDTTHLPHVPLGAVDTMYFRLEDDAVRYFPPIDTLAFDLDTMVLRVPVDTVALDSLAVALDSLAVAADSLKTDAL